MSNVETQQMPLCGRCGIRVKWYPEWRRWKHLANGRTGRGCWIKPDRIVYSPFDVDPVITPTVTDDNKGTNEV